MRTTIDIDEELLRKVMEGDGLKTKKGAVDKALRTLLRLLESNAAFDNRSGIAPQGVMTGRADFDLEHVAAYRSHSVG
jgi:hypothetical protein